MKIVNKREERIEQVFKEDDELKVVGIELVNQTARYYDKIKGAAYTSVERHHNQSKVDGD